MRRFLNAIVINEDQSVPPVEQKSNKLQYVHIRSTAEAADNTLY